MTLAGDAFGVPAFLGWYAGLSGSMIELGSPGFSGSLSGIKNGLLAGRVPSKSESQTYVDVSLN